MERSHVSERRGSFASRCSTSTRLEPSTYRQLPERAKVLDVVAAVLEPTQRGRPNKPEEDQLLEQCQKQNSLLPTNFKAWEYLVMILKLGGTLSKYTVNKTLTTHSSSQQVDINAGWRKQGMLPEA